MNWWLEELRKALKWLVTGHGDGPPDRTSNTPPPGLAGVFGTDPPTGPGTPTVPQGPSSLGRHGDLSSDDYDRTRTKISQTDAKLLDQVKEILESNKEARDRITTIIEQIKKREQELKTQFPNDPGMAAQRFQEFVDAKLGEIEDVLNKAKVDAKKQAALLDALGNEYRTHTDGLPPGNQGPSGPAPGDPGAGPGAGAGGGGGGPGGGADPGPGPAAADPSAGLAGLGGGMPGGGLADPLSMLTPALSSLGSIPGSLGGGGAGLPMDALSALAPLASGLAGRGAGDGFDESGGHKGGDHTQPADFNDSHQGKDGDPQSKDGDPQPKQGEPKPAAATAPADPATPAAAAPAAGAGGDAGRVVQMPDGTPVTAPSDRHAVAMRTVLAGGSVTDAWKPYVELPPPGTPVTAPADPAHLPAGAVAQFKTRDPVMYMGNGKIWLDGQLQPLRALPSGDFLGWFDPSPAPAGGTPALATPAPAAAPAPAAPKLAGV